MLRVLRLRLSLLYLAASLGLVALMGAATYGLLSLYFQRSTDLALQVKMAIEFESHNLSLPAALATAEQDWLQQNNRPAGATAPAINDGDEGSGTVNTAGVFGTDGEDRYDSRLAPVFVLSGVDASALAGLPVVNDPAAIAAAQKNGADLRTVQLENGSRLRLLSYRLKNGSVLQVGRLLGDQERVLSQYLTGLLILGCVASLLLALASWVLAGRSIKPAQTAWEQQSQFIANASHELRAPLTILRANADYALRSDSKQERQQSLHDIVEEVDYMNRLVEDLLLLSRLDAHRLGLATELLPVPALLEEAARQVNRLAEERGVKVEVLPSAGLVRGDPDRLRQVLLIVLDNALRFTPAGGSIRMVAYRRGREVEMVVSDSGSGIPPDSLPHMFERFYQVPGQEGSARGNGLGLSIAQSLVQAHRGRINITSQPGRGTQVHILLPTAEK